MEISQHARYTCTFCGKVSIQLFVSTEELTFLVTVGLGEEDGCWNLALQCLQKDYRWGSVDCFNDGGCHRP